MDWMLPNGEPFVGAHYCIWYKGDWAEAKRMGTRVIYTPSRGCYQSGDESIMREHLKEAMSVGINTFCCSWKPPERTPGKVEDGKVGYWNAKGIENYEDENLDKLNRLVQKILPDRFFITVIVENNRLRDDYLTDLEYALVRPDTRNITREGNEGEGWTLTRSGTVKQYAKVISYLLKHYQESWLRLRDPQGILRYAFLLYTINNAVSYDQESLEKFRNWLEAKHGGVDALNREWGTRFQSFNAVVPDLEGNKAVAQDTAVWFAQEVDGSYEKIASEVKARTGKDIALFGCTFNNRLFPKHDGTHIPAKGRGISGFWDYGYFPRSWDHTLYELDRGLQVKICREREKFVALTCFPGFDDRYLPHCGRRVGDHDPRDPEKFARRLGTVLKLKPHGLFITSYNEWWESTAIEPAEEYGRVYLDIAGEYTRHFKAYQLIGR